MFFAGCVWGRRGGGVVMPRDVTTNSVIMSSFVKILNIGAMLSGIVPSDFI